MNNLKNKILIILAITIWSGTAHALPQGANIAGGNSTISQPDAGTMHINQTTDKAIINWQAYGINANEAVTYFQPGSGSISLNRVTGADPSLIYGQLSANGQVWVINPNGLLIGPNANINVGGFLGSTLNITDQNFLSGNYNFKTVSSQLSAISNYGDIQAADGGYVVFISATINNQGNITANNGSVNMASGDDVTLTFANNGLINLTINKQAAADALGIENKGQIAADGGEVVISAQVAGDILKTVVNNQGIIQARTIENKNGVIKLLGSMDNNTIQVGGTLDASAPNGGDGGFIETSAHNVELDNPNITASAPYGKGGEWLTDPTNFLIDALIAAAYSATLSAGTNVTVATSAAGAEPGNITVASNISKTAGTDATFTLRAHNNIIVNDTVSISSTSNALNVVFNADSDSLGGGNIQMRALSSITTNGGNITFGGGADPSTTAAVGSAINFPDNYGIYLNSTTLNAGTGSISLRGQGQGVATGGAYDYGILAQGGTAIQTTSGNITINGRGGEPSSSSEYNIGVFLNNAIVSSATGAISITGQGTAISGYDSYGIRLANGAGVTSTGSASITLDGRGTGDDGGGTAAYAGIYTATSGASNTIGGASSTGTITLTANTATGADSISLSGLTIQGSGNLVLQPLNTSTTIGIAGGAGTFNLSNAELALIQSGFNSITIGRSDGTGAITFGDGAGAGTGYTFNANTIIRGLSSNISITDPFSTGLFNTTFNTTGTATQTAAISAAGLELLGTGGTYTFTNTSNAISTLAGNTGTVSYSQPGSLAVGTVNTAGLTASNTLLMRTTGAADITLNNTVTANGTGDALVLAAGRNFINNVGATPLSATNGRYLVYSTNPAQNTFGSFTSPGNAFGRTYASNPPGHATINSLTGSRMIYSITPPLTITADAITRLYGDVNPALTYILTGLVAGDSVSGALSTTAIQTSSVGTYPITQGTLAVDSTLGYSTNFTGNNLTVNPAPLTLTANTASRLYGDANPAFSGTATGFKLTDTLASATTGTLTFTSTATATSNVGSYGITGSGLTANNGNYTFAQAAGNATALTVNPAPLTITADDKAKVYGDTNPALTAAYSGFKNGETSAVVSGLALATPATTASNVGTYAITASGATASNYTITHRNGVLTVTSTPNHDYVIQEGIGRSLSSSYVSEPVPQTENKFEGVVVITSEFPYTSKHTDLQPLAVNYQSSKACLAIGDGKYPMIAEVDCK